MYKITTDGIKDGISPFKIETTLNPLVATLSEFFKILDIRGLEIPQDLVIKNGLNKIVFEYSYLEDVDSIQTVHLIFNIQIL